MPKIQKKLEATSGKLHEIHDSVNRIITGAEKRVSRLEKTIVTKVNRFEKTVDKKVDNLEKTDEGKHVIMDGKNQQPAAPATGTSLNRIRKYR